MTEQQWLERLAGALGVPAPTEEERESLLALAGMAAHASERTAAPLSCWLAGRAGVAPDQARQLAKQLTGEQGEAP
ncbi:MAG: DUF6457 domain-containing protein [Acidimicrobiales bacterium]